MSVHHRRAWRIGAIYALFGALWIILSDRLLVFLIPDPAQQAQMQTWKGWFYVIVTALLVVALVRRAMERQNLLLLDAQSSEARLRAGEERLRAITENAPAFIAELDRQGRFLYLSRIATGEDPADVIGNDFTLWVPEEERESLRRTLELVFSSGATQKIETRGAGPGGITSWYSTRISLQLNPDGVRTAILVSQDITQQREAEQARLESEARFRALFEQAAVGVAQLATESGRFLLVNDKYCEILGYSLDEMSLMDVRRITHPDDLPRYQILMEQLLQGGIRDFSMEARHYRKDGRIVWVDLNMSARWLKREAPEFLIAVVQDVTARRQAEHALVESEERYRLLFDSNPQPMWVFDRDSLAFLAVNDAAVATYGWSRAEFLSMRISDIRPQEDVPALLETIAQAGEGRDEPGIWRHLKKSGEEILVEITAHTLDFVMHRADLVLALDVTERERSRRRLLESETRLRLAMTAANQGLYDLNVQTGDAVISPEYAVMLGYQPDELRETNALWRERLHPDDHAVVSKAYEDYIAGRSTEYCVEFRQRLKTGGWKWILSLGRMMEWSADGKPLRMLGTHTDITVRREAETALRESEERYRRLFLSMTTGFALHEVILDESGIPVDYRFLEVNPAYEAATGLVAAGIIGRTVREVFPAVDDEWIQRFGQVALSGEPVHFERFSVEVGRSFDVLAYSPRELQFAVLVRDVTKIRHDQEELRETTRLLSLLRVIDTSIISACPLQETQELVVKTLRELVPCRRVSIAVPDEKSGLWRSVVVDADRSLVLSPGSLFSVPDSWMEQYRKGQPVQVEVLDKQQPEHLGHRALAGEGMRAFLHLPLFVQGQVLGSLNLAHDQQDFIDVKQMHILAEVANQLAIAILQKRLTDEVARHAVDLEHEVVARTRELQIANHELEAFAYSVSHDLRAPLRAIGGFSRILEEDYAEVLGDEGRRLLQVVQSSTQRMDRLISDLLALSRITRTPLKREIVDMESLVKAVHQELSSDAQQSLVTLRMGSLPVARGDPGLLRQVWSNLISNALKFRRPGEPGFIEIMGEPVEGELRYHVADDGVGFDPTYAHKLFDVFQRLHAPDEFEGTGVGLALVQRVVNRHGGRVWAEGSLEHGAIFHFSLPQQGEHS